MNTDVFESPFGRPDARTKVWWSDRVRKDAEKFFRKGDPNKQYLKALNRYAHEGFEYFTGDDRPIRHERNGVYRIGIGSSRFRMIGFFAEGNREFIIMDCWLKPGQSLTKAQQERLDEVARICKEQAFTYVPRKDEQ